MRLRLGMGFVAVGVLMVCWAAASAEEPKKADEKKDNKAPTFKADVAPLLKDACAGCHSGSKKKARLDIESYDSVMKMVKASEADKSRLYKSLLGKGARQMPPKNPLEEKQIAVIKAWIDAGAKNE